MDESQLELSAGPDDADVAIVIALPEEFGFISTLLPSPSEPSRHVSPAGYSQYIFHHRVAADGRLLRCVAQIVGEMGEVEAALATDAVLRQFRPKLLLSLGISGS